MSQRETLLMSIYIEDNKQLFKNYIDVKKMANALKAKLEYLRKTKDGYCINAFIGISRLNIRYGNLRFADNKKVGRNKIIVVPKAFKTAKDMCYEPLHLHILIEANPGETIAKLVVNYINKKFNRNIAKRKKIDRGFFRYVMRQSEKARFVVEDSPSSVLRYNFKELYESDHKPATKTKKLKDRKLLESFRKNLLNNSLRTNNDVKYLVS